MNEPADTHPRPASVLLAVAAVALIAVLLGGLVLAAGVIAPTYDSSIALGAAWFVLAGFALGRLVKTRPALRAVLRPTFLATAIAVGGLFAWTSLRDTTVNEQVVTGARPSAPAPNTAEPVTAPAGNVEVAAGRFRPRAHQGRGRAAVVELGSGQRKLTLTDFATDAGPDLRIYLVAGSVRDDGDVGDFVDLGALKGNKGNQQYEIPRSVDLSRHGTVVIWCRAFTVSFAQANLEATA